MPHIRPRPARDAFFGQGHCVARDRLFQLDLDHRRETGRVAEAFDPGLAEHDALMRLLQHHGDSMAGHAVVPDAVRDRAEGYLAGIDASTAEDYLMLCDIGDRDDRLFLLLPGQSAEAGSPHRRDPYAPWIGGAMQPMPLSRAAVNAAARSRTVPLPEGR